MENVISVSSLTFSYAQGQKLFSSLSFNVEELSFTALIGSNGSGKSTLVKLILGELEPKEGSIELFGVKLSHFKDWSKLSYVSQEGLAEKRDFPTTVKELAEANLYAKTGLFRFPSKAQKAEAEACLEEVGMAEYKNTLIGNLSGGQRQRALVASALVSGPKLLILDEPSTGMDEASALSFYELLRKLNKEKGLTIFMVSHDLDRISEYVTDVLCLDYGSIVRLTPSELKGEREHMHSHPRKEK